MRILIGSTAIKYYYPDFRREPHDIDYFCDDADRPNHVHCLSEDIVTHQLGRVECFYQPAIRHWFDFEYPNQDWFHMATPDQLYTIKVSHAFWELRNGSWNKHMFDTAFLKDKGAVLIPDFYEVLYAVWEERYGVKKANLNATPEEFFTKTIDRKYDHDSIHSSIAYNDEPMFNRILRDDAAVAVSRSRFEGLSFEEKVQLVREEAYATALERMLIPRDYKYSPTAAYMWALKKTITSFSKGWFPLWIVENYAAVRKPDINYVQRHLDNKDRLILL